MANLWYGAMAGAGEAALKSMQARQQAYLEEEKQRKLMELRNEQEIEQLRIQDLLEGKKPDKNLTEYTDTGIKFYNSKNELIGERAYNPAEKAARDAATRKDALEVSKLEAQINTEKAQAAKYGNDIRVDNARLSLDRSGGGRRRGSGGDDSTSSGGSLAKPKTLEQGIEALRTTNAGAVKDAAKAGVPDYIIDDVAEAVLRDRRKNAGTVYGKSIPWSFKRALDMTAQQYKQNSK